MLEQLIQEKHSVSDTDSTKPQLFEADAVSSQKALEEMLVKDKTIEVVDHYEDMLRELFTLDHPQLKANKVKLQQEFESWAQRQRDNKGGFTRSGIWAYYPWRQQLVHVVPEDAYYRLRTARNHLLVNQDEQRILRDIRVGIIGLSVGQASAMTLTISGVSKQLKLADPDIIEATNLNRIHAGIADIGLRKTVKVSRLITELDPFANPELFSEAITEGNIDNFLLGDNKLDIVIDAFDDVRMKTQLRKVARKQRIPVIMATDVADGAVIEIDRYDLNPDMKMFGGRIDERELDNLPTEADIKDMAQIAMKMIGVQNPPERMMASIRTLGTEIAGYPQLALASFLGGALTTYVIKQIALGNDTLPPRVEVSLSDLFH
ncbi:MAG: ThiF family adenylyltransferase [Patescibacteria group bacterium]|jgi:molybdopterin/thiamine biosynthesis adenylyltransferase